MTERVINDVLFEELAVVIHGHSSWELSAWQVVKGDAQVKIAVG